MADACHEERVLHTCASGKLGAQVSVLDENGDRVQSQSEGFGSKPNAVHGGTGIGAGFVVVQGIGSCRE